jgi:hypothetical protein
VSGLDPNGGGALVVPGGAGTSLSDATPAALGTAAAGVSTSASRADHVHEAPAGGTTHTSGTLAARPAVPAAGDSYAVTSGVAAGDRYECYVAGAWTLTSFDRARLGELAPWARFSCDETSGTSLADSVGGIGALTISGTHSLSSATGVGRGLRMSGGGGAQRTAAAVPTSTRKLALTAWVQLDSAAGLQTIFARIGSWGSVYASIAIGTSSGVLRGYVACGGASTEAKTGAIALTTGVPHLVTIEWDGDASDRLTLTLDGSIEYAGTPSTGTADLVYALTSPVWQIGTNPSGESLSGVVREVQVYDGAVLTPAQRRELYARGTGTYGGQ